jgi:hypothetical protein
MRLLAIASLLVAASVAVATAGQPISSTQSGMSTSRSSENLVTVLGCVKEGKQPGTYVLENAEDLTQQQGTGGYVGATASAGTSGSATGTSGMSPGTSQPRSLKSYPLKAKTVTLREYVGQKVQVKGNATRPTASSPSVSPAAPASSLQREDIESIEVETVLILAAKCDG